MIRKEGIAARALATLSEHSGLARYEAACRAIAEAKSVDEVKAIRDTAEAMRAAAHIAKNKQAEIDMAEIRFRGERRLGELMAAQRDSVGLNHGSRLVGPSATRQDERPTLAEAGIDKHLADRARKFAAIPDDEFDNIVGDWRGKVEAENERVTTNLLKAGERAEQGRHDNDFYPTPDSLIAEVVARWRPRSKRVWEPCVGDGRVASALRSAGYSVVTGDIAQGQDFFASDAPYPDIALCTNPPFGRVREFIDHAFSIGIREMCLVLPERLWASGIGREQFERHRPSAWANMDWREDYLGKGGSPDRALAVAIWDGACSPVCKFDVWTRQAIDAETFDPETGELTDTQEQPDEPATRSLGTGDGGDQSPNGAVLLSTPQGAGMERGIDQCVTAGETAPHSPSPETPQAIADDEATPPAQSSATIQPDPLPPVVDDGQPSPSANVPPAQKASPRSDVGQAGVKPGINIGEFAQQSASAAQTRNEPGSASGASVTLPQSEIPAFLRKSAADYRPNCQHPDACGSSNPTGHCYTCKRAMEAAESEVAA